MSESSTNLRVPPYRMLVLSLTIAIVATPLLVGVAYTQAVDIPAIMDPDLKAPPTAAVVQYGHQFKVDVDNDGTEMSRDNAFFSLAHRVKLSDTTSFFALGSYTLHAYNFSGGRSQTAPVNYYQWDDVHRMVLAGLVGHDLNDKWRIIGGGVFRSWGESGANYGKSITGGLIGGFDYHPNEDFSIGLLVGAFSALEDSVGLLPVPTLKWRFADDWRLNVGMVSVADPGVGAEISWQISDELAMGAGGAFQSRRYRLADGSRLPTGANLTRPFRNDGGGIGQESEVPIYGLIRWKPTAKTAIDLQGGVAVAGNVRVEDRDGNRIKDDGYDPAPFLALKGQIFF